MPIKKESFSTKHRILSTIACCAALTIVGWLSATLLLLAVYTIPTETMHDALVSSNEWIQQHKNDPERDSTGSERLNLFTDAAMVGMAAIPIHETPLKAALRNACPKKNKNTWGPVSALNKLAKGKNYAVGEYPRYWNGYLIWLKPMLALGIGVGTIYIIKAIYQLALLIAIFALLYRAKRAYLIPALVMLLVSIRFWVIPFAMQYSSVMEIALVATLVMLIVERRTKNPARKAQFVSVLFFATGLLTSFFDLLTYPVITLGLPLLVSFGCRESLSSIQVGKSTLARLFLTFIVPCLAWALGYLAMWAGKWLIASIVLQQNVFADAFGAFSTRSSTTASNRLVALWAVMKRVAPHYFAERWLVLVMAVIFVAYLARLAWLVKRGRASWKDAVRLAIPNILIAFIPLIWFAATPNHSIVHHFMTYRTLSLAICAVLFALATPGKLEE